MTIACAFVRDSASPRSTRSLSMRSRFTSQTLLWSAANCHTRSGLAARGTRDGARCVGQTKFRCAVVTKPDENVWRVRPEKRSDSSGYLHGIVHAESLQSLEVKCAIVKLAFGSFLAVYTLPLPKHLSRHDESPHFPPHSRGNTKPFIRASGLVIKV